MDAPPTSTLWQRGVRYIGLVEDGVLALLLTVMIAVATLQILLRNLWDTGLVWGEPFTKVLVLWVGLLGAMVATRQRNHINVDVLSRFLPATAKAVSQIINGLFAAAVCAVVAFYAARLTLLDKASPTIAFGVVPTWVCELIIPVGFGAIALRYLLIAAAAMAALVRRSPP